MTQSREDEIQLQFLEEATEHLNTITEAIFILAVPLTIDNQQMDAVLRAAHSIKGGAAMMGFQTLSELARRMEDFLKVLKTQQQQIPTGSKIDALLLSATDHLSRIINCHRQGEDIDEQWLEKFVYPLFEQLHLTLARNPTLKDEATLLEPENNQDLLVKIFETEVEGYLAKLESVLASGALPGLFAETSIMAQELGSLGEMLELTAFSSLCESITRHLEANPERVEEIARMALQEWRRSQALVLVGQVDTIPTSINEGDCSSPTSSVPAPTTIQAKDFNTNHLINKENQADTVRLPIKQLQQLKDYFAQLSQLHERTTFCLAQVSKLLEQVGIPNDEFVIRNLFGNGVSVAPREFPDLVDKPSHLDLSLANEESDIHGLSTRSRNVVTPTPSGNLSKVGQPEIEGCPTLESLVVTPFEPTRQKKTILVVDDDKSIRRFLSSLLESVGYQVELALDGRDALKKLDSGLQVQTVICDLDMPNLDGYGFLVSIKSEPAFAHLPVAMLTSHTEENYRNRAMLLGAAAYFTKQGDQQELINCLSQLIATTPL